MTRRTLEDVARAAGVSLATADRARNGRVPSEIFRSAIG